MKQLFLISIVCVCFSACYTVSDIYIGVLEPAEISLPPDIRNVSIYPGPTVNMNARSQLDSLDNLRLDKDTNYNIFYEKYLTGLAEVLNNSPRLDTIVIGHTEVKQIEPGKISWTEIVKICKKDSTDALIILTDFVLSDSLKIHKNPYIGCFIKYIIYNNPEWIILYPKELKVIEEYNYWDGLVWRAIDQNCEDALKKFPGAETIVNVSFYQAGKLYGKRIAPSWKENINRHYYATGNKLLRKAKKCISKNQWTEATEIWSELAEHAGRNLASKACYNMALACEFEDKFELAKIWLTKSYNIRRCIKTEGYLKTIEERLENKDKLDIQMLNN